MKFRFSRGVSWVWFLSAGILAMAIHCDAQDNSWTSPASGNWEDASWSLGFIPGTNQTVLITNAGWKAVQISSHTTQNFPQSLNVSSIVISSPTNSFNTLLLNYAGFAAPLTVRTLSVASNSAVTMFSSALQINGPTGTGMAIGGEFDQNDSLVAGNQINVGYISPGVYNLNSGYLAVSQLWVGDGTNEGVINQNGGTNAFGITHLDGGNYVLSNGLYGATIYFDGGAFLQYGGLLNTNLTIYEGNYLLAGGILEGGAAVPSGNGYTTGRGSMLQTGGTNYGPLYIGSYGYGSYVMSNGVSLATNLQVDWGGTYDQWDGVQVVTNGFQITEEQINADEFSWGIVNLHGGAMSSGELDLGGQYDQEGGTNDIAGEFYMQGTDAGISLQGGLLAVDNMTLNASWANGVFLTGGRLVVTNQLWIGGTTLPFWQGFSNSAGQLTVSNIWLAPLSVFYCGNGIITQSGTLTLQQASLYAGTNEVQFGPLCLAGNGTNNSSALNMPAGGSLVAFADSSGVTWSNGPALMIENWSGSINGGGGQQILFGKNAGGLTSGQLAQIQFQNPSGLVAGTYAAKMLPSGEIVPDTGVAQASSMAIAPQSNGMQITLQGVAGRNYGIEVSTDCVHWAPWTNVANTNGTMRVTDTDSVNFPARFYRARLMP